MKKKVYNIYFYIFDDQATLLSIVSLLLSILLSSPLFVQVSALLFFQQVFLQISLLILHLLSKPQAETTSGRSWLGQNFFDPKLAQLLYLLIIYYHFAICFPRALFPIPHYRIIFPIPPFEVSTFLFCNMLSTCLYLQSPQTRLDVQTSPIRWINSGHFIKNIIHNHGWKKLLILFSISATEPSRTATSTGRARASLDLLGDNSTLSPALLFK